MSEEVPIVAMGLVGGVVVHLKSLYVDEAKKIYRPGKEVEMPDADARKLGIHPDQLKKAAASGTTTDTEDGGGGGDTDPDAIPDDFPGAASLRKADFNMQDVREATREDLLALDGIGEATADKILEARGI
jgi:hypothetical protein